MPAWERSGAAGSDAWRAPPKCRWQRRLLPPDSATRPRCDRVRRRSRAPCAPRPPGQIAAAPCRSRPRRCGTRVRRGDSPDRAPRWILPEPSVPTNATTTPRAQIERTGGSSGGHHRPALRPGRSKPCGCHGALEQAASHPLGQVVRRRRAIEHVQHCGRVGTEFAAPPPGGIESRCRVGGPPARPGLREALVRQDLWPSATVAPTGRPPRPPRPSAGLRRRRSRRPKRRRRRPARVSTGPTRRSPSVKSTTASDAAISTASDRCWSPWIAGLGDHRHRRQRPHCGDGTLTPVRRRIPPDVEVGRAVRGPSQTAGAPVGPCQARGRRVVQTPARVRRRIRRASAEAGGQRQGLRPRRQQPMTDPRPSVW